MLKEACRNLQQRLIDSERREAKLLGLRADAERSMQELQQRLIDSERREEKLFFFVLMLKEAWELHQNSSTVSAEGRNCWIELGC